MTKNYSFCEKKISVTNISKRTKRYKGLCANDGKIDIPKEVWGVHEEETLRSIYMKRKL